MREQELIKEIKKLRMIKPSKDWVLSTKKYILGDYKTKPGGFWIFRQAPAFALPLLVMILIGGSVFVVSQSGVSKSFLYSYLGSNKEIAKTIEEQQKDESEFYLSLAEQKIKELKAIAQKEGAQNDQKTETLASAIEETKKAIKKAAESIPQTAEDPEQSAKIVEKVNTIQAEKEEIEGLGVKLGDKEVEQLKSSTLACLTNSIDDTESEMARFAERVKREIEEQETKTLSQSEKEALEEAKQLYQQGNYPQALEKLLNK